MIFTYLKKISLLGKIGKMKFIRVSGLCKEEETAFHAASSSFGCYRQIKIPCTIAPVPYLYRNKGIEALQVSSPITLFI